MSNTIVLKKSSVANKKPQATDLVFGELALNYTDGLLYYKDNNSAIKAFAAGGFADPSTNSSMTMTVDAQGNPIMAVKVSGIVVAQFGGGQLTFNVPLSMNGNTITALSAPIGTTDAVNKAYADGAASASGYPKGDYGDIVSAAAYDAFGVPIVAIITYDNMEPIGVFNTVDFGALA